MRISNTSWRAVAAGMLRPLCLILVCALWAVGVSAQTVLMGDQTLESNLDTNAVGLAEAFPFTATTTGSVGSINFFLDESSTSTKVYVGIYKDSSGKPGSLLTQGSTTQLYPGTWNSATVTTASVTSGTAYWIAILGTTGGQPYFYDRSTTTCHSQTSSQTTLTSLPSTWSTGKTWNTCYISAYAVTGTLAATDMIGDQAVETYLDKNPAGRAEAFPAIANTTGAVGTIALYLDPTSGSGPVTVGLYADNGSGHPGTLLGQGFTSSPAAGSWNQIAITSSSVTAGKRYWIAVLGTQATSPYFRDRQTTVCHSETTPTSTYTSLPSTWTTGTIWNTCYISAYGLPAANAPVLALSSSTISFTAIQGGANPSPANLNVTNTGTGTLTFTDSTDQSWLSATPASGTAPQTLQVSATTGSLTAGTYTGHVTVTAAGAQNSPAVATVTFTVAAFIPPTISAAASPAPNANGWNNSTVTVTFTCTAGSYAIQTCPSPVQVTTQAANQQICGQAVDTHGDKSTQACATVNLDETAPTITATATPAADSNGWNNTNVTVTFACSDSLSGIVACPSPVTVSTAGANQVVSGTTTDKAGNSATAKVTLNIEFTLPSIAATATPAANANGWNNSNVTVSYTCTQALAPITSCPSAQVVSTEGASQVITGTVTDAANNSNTAKVTLNIGKTAPKITASASPAANSNGWNNTAVTVTFTCTAGTAPIASCPQPQTVSTAGAGQVISGTVTDLAGNTASTSVTLNIEIKPPTITGAISPAPNAAGWNNTSVTVTWTCAPGLAPIAVTSSPSAVTTEGANQVVTGTCTDVAGNSASTNVAVNSDKTPPTITATVSPAPNAAGWNNSSVTVNFTCTDALSGVATCPGSQVVATPGANQTVSGTATDAAGNSASTSITLNISETPPVIIATVAPQPNAAGWNNTNVTVTFTCTPGGAPITTCPLPQVVSTEGKNQAIAGTVVDAAGSTATTGVVLNIDKTPPTVIPNISPAPNANGWETTPVTVSFTCTDGLSGVATCPSSGAISTDGANQPVSGTATDVAGNTATASANVNLEQALPVITASVSPAANSYGWNNTPVTVTFTCTKSVSNITSCPSPQPVSTQGVGQIISGTVQDQAGNHATTSVTLSIDLTPPSILQFTAPSQLSPGQSGSATLSVSDTAPIASVVFQLNGTAIGTATIAPYSVNVSAPGTATSGSTLTLTAVVTDVAGNQSSANKGIQVVSNGVLVGQVLSDATGLPQAGATVQVVGQSGESATSDSQGRYSIPVTNSQLYMSISQLASGGSPAMVTVERQVSVQPGVGTVPVDARLTALAPPTVITASGGTVGTGAITITVPAGGSTTSFTLTPLSQQGLPGLLPLGWSPVAAFDLQASASTSASLSANFTRLPAGTLYLVAYSYNVHAWNMVTPNLSASNGSLTASLPSVGDYALVVPDAGNTSIQIPAAGQPLTGIAVVALPTNATSSGSLSPANIAPTGGTSIASLAVQSGISLPSGTVIQAKVTEKYTLANGQKISDEPRFEDILVYQTPAPAGSAAAASFPVTPSQTFQVAQLTSGDVHMDILSGRESVRGETGGSAPVAVQSGDATLTVAGGSLPQDTVIAVNPEPVDTFLPSTSTLVPLAEYNIDFSEQTLNNAAQLSVGTQGVAPGTNVVIAEVRRVGGVPYLVVVSMAQVTATNIVSQSTPGLPGITQGGDYVFYELTIPTGFVSGTVSANSAPVAAMVQTDAMPFVAFSDANGAYTVLAAAGTVNLTATVPNTALSGTATLQVAAAQTTPENLTVVGQVEAATITPANGALGVPLTAEIDITVAGAINPSTVLAANLILTAAGSNSPVPVRFVFSDGNTKLAVFPLSALMQSTQYTFQATGIANDVGGLISVPTISFTTQAITAPTFNTNALVFAMPDQNGNVAISAPANSFPPGSTILIVDQTNGVVESLTVFNDGSVTGQMPATINDTLQVTITAPDKTTTTFTISQFVAADGTTAVGPGGGTVVGPGKTGIIIPQGALAQGVTFKLTQLDQTAFPVLPSWSGVNFGSGLRIHDPAMPTFQKEAKLAFPVPANAPSNAFYYVFRRLLDQSGNAYFETIDQAFVQGSGPNAQVVTASPPFCGYHNSFGKMGVAQAGTPPMPLTLEDQDYFVMWDATAQQGAAGFASTGLIVGRVSEIVPGSSPETTQPATGVFSVVLNSPNPASPAPIGLTIYDAQCGTFTIFDPLLGGGSRSVTATNGQQVLTATVDEVNGPQTDDGLYAIYAGLEDLYKNVGRINFLFAAPQQPPPPPQINIAIINANTSQPITGIVQTETPLTVTFSSNLTVQSVSINGSACDGIACPTLTVATPSNPIPGVNYYQLSSAYTPSNLGLTTISAVGVYPLGTNPPVTVSRSFLVVEAGGGNTYATPNTPPAVISNYPLPYQQNVATTIFPEITFSEPVVNVPGNVTLRGSPAGDTPAVLLIGTKNDGSIANPVGANDPITSLTIQPLNGLEFGETYTLTLSSGIVNVGTDQNGNPIPKLQLPTYTLSFTTAAPSQLGQASSANEVITRPVVIGQRAYAGEYLSSTLSGLGIFDISTPSSPVDLGVPVTFIGRAIDAAGLAQSPVTGGPLVAVSASATQDILIPGNVWLYDVSNPNMPVRAGAVSVTNSSTGAGIAVRLAMKDQYLYASTVRQGLQVIDLSQAIPEFQATPTAQFVQAVTTDGEGFAMDSIINTIQLPIPTAGANPAPCGAQGVCGTATMFGLQADNFVTTGGTQSSVATQTLLVATGQLPLVVADPTLSGTSAILYPAVQYNSPEALNNAPLQSLDGTYQLQQGRAVALTTIAYTDKTGLTTNMHVAVIVGSGTVTANGVAAGTSLLAVVDMSQPYTPGSPFTIKPIGFVQLVDQNGNPVVATDVTISGTVACVATGSNILLVNLENPNQPTAAGQINGSFGDWVTLSSSGYLVSTLTTPTNSIQTANLNGSGRPQTGRCRECEKVVGSPINVTNGNVYVEQADYAVPGLGGGIQIDRTWNSLWENSGPVELSGIFGNSWRSTYEERLVFPPPASSSQPSTPPPPVQYWLGDGTVWYFSLSQSANLFYTVSSPATEHATLVPAATLTSSTIYFTDGSKKVFNGAGYLTAIIDRNGNQTTINYDSSSRISTVISAGGQTLTFNYGAGKQVQSIQDSMGTVATYTYDGSARLTKVLYPDGSALNMNYDPSTDLLTGVTDAHSRIVESHTYDSARRGLTSVRANGVDSVKVQYTGPGQAQVVNSNQISTSYSSAVFGGDNHTTQITGPGCSSCGGRNNSSFFYDGSGNRTSSTDAQGRVATLTYDANSNILSSSVSLGSSAITWKHTYNNFSEVLTATDPMGNTTTNTYDPKGNLLSVTTPPPGNGAAASVTQFAYDSLGELTQVTDPLKHSTALTYTSSGLIRTITDAQGNVVTYSYDGRGNRTAVKDALGNTTSFTYDPINRLTVITYPDSTTTQFGYDWRGRRISVTDQNGKTTNYSYDDADRVTSVRDAAGNTTKYGYDSENNPIAITDANQQTTQFFYNNLDWITKTTFPSGLSESYAYDNLGNLTAKTDRKSQTIQYSYDSLNRMTTKIYPDGTAVNYTYDNNSQLTKVTDATGTYQFMFDNMGRLIGTDTQYSFLTSKTFTTSYSYDAASNRVGFMDPEGGNTTYAYDSLNRLQTLTPPIAFTAGAAANSFGYSYDALSRRKQITRPSGVATNYAYDNVSRLLNVLHQAGANTLDGTSYSYDPTGNRTGKTNQRTNVSTTYGYDAIYELLSATQDGTDTESYTYDPAGNRLSSLGVAQYSYNASNELTSNSNGSYAYDANGNALSDPSGKTFTWDFENRLTSVFVPGTGTTTFKYDPFGRRIQKSGPVGTAIYAYDADDQIEETNSSGGVVARYSQSLSTDEPLVMLRSGTADFYDADGLGSITSLSDVAGTLVQTYEYNSFGATSGVGGITNPFQYTSREADPETGLYYYRYRYYDPTTGRFINEDPSGFAGGGNFYSYVGNSATDFVDSYGLAPGDWWDPRSYSYGSMVTKENGWATLRDVGTASEAFADALTFGSASRLNNALGANVAVDRCGIGHKLGAASGIVASIALSGKGLPKAAKGLSNGAKGAIGEGLSTAENTLRGGTRLGTQVSGRALGLSTRFDSVWQSANGTTYYVESKFGTSGLTAAQRVAQAALGDAYHVERWTYPFLGRIGAYLGAGWGAAGAGRSCGCK